MWRGDGGGLIAWLASLVGADGPASGEHDVFGDGCAEVVGGVAGESSVELVAVMRRIWVGPLHSPVRVEDLLGLGCLASSGCIEAYRVGGARLGVSGQSLVDHVFEAPGEGLVVLFAGDEDGGLSGRVCRYIRLPGECQWLAVHAGCLHGGCRAGIDSAWLALPSSPMHDADEKPDA